MASVISFCFLLLVAYSYSAPILQEYENSTSEYEYTTNPIIVEQGSSINMHLLSDDESTGVPTIQKSRSSEESNSDEITTDNVARSSRTFEQSSYPLPTESSEEHSYETSSYSTSTELPDKRNYEPSLYLTSTEIQKKRNFDESSDPSPVESSEEHTYETSSYLTSTEIQKKRNLDEPSETESSESHSSEESKRNVEDFLFTTLESSAEFNQRAIRPIESQEELESSTIYSENQVEITTDVQPLSSADLFGKYTGLLNDQQSSTSEYELTTDLPSEESTTPLPIKTQRLTKTVSIIPGKVSQTKVFINSPSKTSVLIQPVEQEQLSQGQSQ
jgi:hypothetical protein